MRNCARVLGARAEADDMFVLLLLLLCVELHVQRRR